MQNCKHTDHKFRNRPWALALQLSCALYSLWSVCVGGGGGGEGRGGGRKGGRERGKGGREEGREGREGERGEREGGKEGW